MDDNGGAALGIDLYFVRATSGTRGIASVPSVIFGMPVPPAERINYIISYIDKAFINDLIIANYTGGFPASLFVPGHEVLHLLIDNGADVGAGGHTTNPTHLLREGVSAADTTTSSKRISGAQEKTIYENRNVDIVP